MTTLELKFDRKHYAQCIELARRSAAVNPQPRAERFVVDRPVFLIDEMGARAVPCILRNSSDSGALLDFPPMPPAGQAPDFSIGERMTLVILALNSSDVAAVEIVRVAPNQIGVRYRTSFATFVAPAVN